MFGQNFWQQVAQANIDFFLKHIAGKIDDVHSVGQNTRNLVFDVAGTDEEHLREIIGDFQVMIGEDAVLFRVKHFQQRRTGVAAILGGEFVNLVEQEHGVAHAHGLHRLDDTSR